MLIWFFVKNNIGYVDHKYAYSILDSCITNVGALRNQEKYAQEYCKWYQNGILDFPDEIGLVEYQPTPVPFNDKVSIIYYSEDSSYAKVQFSNPWKGMYENLYTNKYMEGFIPTNLLHNVPGDIKLKCSNDAFE